MCNTNTGEGGEKIQARALARGDDMITLNIRVNEKVAARDKAAA